MLKLDFNRLPGTSGIGDPHWLSGSGKVDRKGNHKRHRDAYLAALPHTPARPETTAKLEASSERIRKKYAPALKIHGVRLSAWARNIAAQDAERIHTAIGVGLTAGEDNTDIAHRVIGSRRMNGVNGATEVTRQHIIRLGKGLLHKRKTRMSGA